MTSAIIFDLDNTLTHREKSIESFSIYFFNLYQSQMIEESVDHIIRIIKETDNGGYGRAENPSTKIKHSIAIRLTDELRWRRPPSTDELLNCWMMGFPKHSVEMPEGKNVIRQLVDQGCRLGIISNGAEESRIATLEYLQLLEYFDVVISSDRFGCKKPDVRIFNAAVQQLGCVASQCIYVGDNPLVDIMGAHEAGLTGVWLEGFHDWPATVDKPKYSISSLPELIPLLSIIGKRGR